MIATLLAIIVQYAVGDQIRIVHVSELISDDEDFFTNGKDNSHICCVYGNCSCNSLDHALANLTSNLLINITTDVTLSSLIERSDLQNVSIIGHNNPTVNCKTGGVQFTFCHNCIIQGITWDRCGSITKAGLKLNDHSNVTIQNCSFQHSLGQALVLSEVSGYVNINNCNFVNNSHYRDHGVAIHYYSNKTNDSTPGLIFNIKGCKINHNKYATSLVYIENGFEHSCNVTLCNSIFQDNEGVSIFLVNQKLCLNGIVLFLNNSAADNGTGIYISNHSTVVFGENSDVTFIQNSADTAGGVIFSRNHSSILFHQNSKVSFSSNSAGKYGAAICSLENSDIIVTGNSEIEFKGIVGKRVNLKFHGIIYIEKYVRMSFESNATARFSNNTALTGGAIHAISSCHISLKGNSSVVFTNNNGKYGGAVYLRSFSNICFEENSTTVFNNNSVSNYGGALRAYDNSNISFKGNSITVFKNNPASNSGGAISTYNSSISFEESSVIQFSNNSAEFGGAVDLLVSNVCFKGSSTIVFNSNAASKYSGAIHTFDNSKISFKGNSVIQFNNNTAKYGGAVYVRRFSYAYFEENSTIVFNNNTALKYGGAIRNFDNSNICFKGNSATVFNNNAATNNNAASSYGGAIGTYYSNNVSFEGNSTVVFNNNAASKDGGAIYTSDYSNIYFRGNSATVFNNNVALDYGGGICTTDYSNISFEANSTTVFHNNTGSNYGGAISINGNSNTVFEGSSISQFSGNTAVHGAALDLFYNSFVSFKGNSITLFSNNIALGYGAVVFAKSDCNTTFDGNSEVNLTNNKAPDGAIVYSKTNSRLMAKGDASVTFNDTQAKWCKDVCLPYTHSQYDDVVTVDAHGIVRCSYHERFICQMRKCYCNEFQRDINNDSLIIVTDTITLSSPVSFANLHNISIIGHNNPFVYCVNDSRLTIMNSINVVMEGITWIGCGKNELLDDFTETNFNILDSTRSSEQPMDSAIHLQFSLDLTIQNCAFLYSEGRVVVMSELSGEVKVSLCDFLNNSYYKGHGAAIHYSSKNSSQCSFTIKDCNFAHNRFAKSLVYIENTMFEKNNNITIYDSKFYHNQGVCIQVENQNVYLTGKVSFSNNIATNGSGIYITDNSTVMFGEDSVVAFNENIANRKGSAVFLQGHSTIIFDQNSKVTFHDNKAINGTIYSETSSNVIFTEYCQVTFGSNSASQYGAAIHSFGNSNVTF